MTVPLKDYGYETPFDISINEYRLIDSLKDKFSVKDIDNEDVNSFLCLNNNLNNIFMNLLLDISNRIKNINPTIKLSLKVVRDEYYYEEILKISAKIDNFEDSYKIEELNNDLSNNYSFELLDKIILSLEF